MLLGAMFIVATTAVVLQLATWPPEGGGQVFQFVTRAVFVMIAGFSFWGHWRSQVEATPQGLRIRRYLSTNTVAWDDVAQIGGDAPGPWATTIVITTKDGATLNTELPAGHEGILDYWDAVHSAR